MKRYIALVGPLLGLYYPIPDDFEPDDLRRWRLAGLGWNIYTEAQIDATDKAAIKLPDDFAMRMMDMAGASVPRPTTAGDSSPRWTGD